MKFKYCQNCGKRIPAKETFCQFCGHRQPVQNHPARSRNTTDQARLNKRSSYKNRPNRTKRSRLSRSLKWLSIACLVLAVGCIYYEPLKTDLVNHYSPKITRQDVLQGDHNKNTTYNMSQVKPVSMSQVVSARMHANHLPVVGQIMVPSVGIHLPIGRGVDSQTLMLAAGTMKPHQQMGKGNYALAGHHMINKSALFTPLWFHAKKGTLVYLTDMKNVFVYQINVRKIISPYDTGVINDTGQPILTLITCNDSGSKRLLLQGKLTKVTPLAKASSAIKSDANRRTNNHNVLKGY